MKKILLCDDHSILRRGLKHIIKSNFGEFEIEESSTIKDTNNYLKDIEPDFAIFDLQVADGNMMEYLPTILTFHPKLKVLIYSMCSESIYGKRSLQMGTQGFLSKASDEAEVKRALNIFLSGNNYLSTNLNNILLKDLQKGDKNKSENPFNLLSNREIEISRNLLSGKSTKQISESMNLHSNTVVTYKKRVFEKLSIKNLIELINVAQLHSFS